MFDMRIENIRSHQELNLPVMLPMFRAMLPTLCTRGILPKLLVRNSMLMNMRLSWLRKEEGREDLLMLILKQECPRLRLGTPNKSDPNNPFDILSNLQEDNIQPGVGPSGVVQDTCILYHQPTSKTSSSPEDLMISNVNISPVPDASFDIQIKKIQEDSRGTNISSNPHHTKHMLCVENHSCQSIPSVPASPDEVCSMLEEVLAAQGPPVCISIDQHMLANAPSLEEQMMFDDGDGCNSDPGIQDTEHAAMSKGNINDYRRKLSSKQLGKLPSRSP